MLLFSQLSQTNPFNRILISLGEASLYMWFLHAAFFTATVAPLYQWLINWSSNPLLIYLSTVILSFLAARLCMWVPKFFLKTKNGNIKRV